MAEAPPESHMVLETMRQAGGVPLARSWSALRSVLGTATRLLSRRYFSLAVLLAVPTTVVNFLLRTLGSMQAAQRRRALADVAARRRQEAQDNISSVLAETQGSAKSGPQQDVVGLSFLELQKRLKDGKLTAQTVLAAYRAQAGRAHARVNCLTEFLPEAVQVAQVAPRPKRATYMEWQGCHGCDSVSMLNPQAICDSFSMLKPLSADDTRKVAPLRCQLCSAAIVQQLLAPAGPSRRVPPARSLQASERVRAALG
jgi:hypothetical protein